MQTHFIIGAPHPQIKGTTSKLQLRARLCKAISNTSMNPKINRTGYLFTRLGNYSRNILLFKKQQDRR